MQRASIIALAVLLLSFTLEPAFAQNDFEGVWTGGWESGKIKLTVSKDASGKPVAKLWVAPDNGEEYTTGFSEFVLEGKTMRAKYTTPDSDPGEVVLRASLEGDTLQGTWQFKQKNSGETHGGNWKATRQ
jgi:hypothetical protein